jgi:hypothetical protein
MKTVKYLCAAALCALVHAAFASDTDGMKITHSDIRVCRESDKSNRFDVRLSLQNKTNKNIRFDATTARDGGLAVYPYQVKASFCLDDGECDIYIPIAGSYVQYGLDVSVRPIGEFLYTDYVILGPKSNNPGLKGVFDYELRGGATVNNVYQLSFKAAIKKEINMDSVPACPKPDKAQPK